MKQNVIKWIKIWSDAAIYYKEGRQDTSWDWVWPISSQMEIWNKSNEIK